MSNYTRKWNAQSSCPIWIATLMAMGMAILSMHSAYAQAPGMPGSREWIKAGSPRYIATGDSIAVDPTTLLLLTPEEVIRRQRIAPLLEVFNVEQQRMAKFAAFRAQRDSILTILSPKWKKLKDTGYNPYRILLQWIESQSDEFRQWKDVEELHYREWGHWSRCLEPLMEEDPVDNPDDRM